MSWEASGSKSCKSISNHTCQKLGGKKVTNPAKKNQWWNLFPFFHGIFQHSTNKYSSIFPFRDFGTARKALVSLIALETLKWPTLQNISLSPFPGAISTYMKGACRGSERAGYRNMLQKHASSPPPHQDTYRCTEKA